MIPAQPCAIRLPRAVGHKLFRSCVGVFSRWTGSSATPRVVLWFAPVRAANTLRAPLVGPPSRPGVSFPSAGALADRLLTWLPDSTTHGHANETLSLFAVSRGARRPGRRRDSRSGGRALEHVGRAAEQQLHYAHRPRLCPSGHAREQGRAGHPRLAQLEAIQARPSQGRSGARGHSARRSVHVGAER
ncbi:hypothetical protein D3C85_1066010 [compost metagenome]